MAPEIRGFAAKREKKVPENNLGKTHTWQYIDTVKNSWHTRYATVQSDTQTGRNDYFVFSLSLSVYAIPAASYPSI